MNVMSNITNLTRLHYSNLKRFLDIVLASALLIILSPIMIIVALLVKMTSSGPIIFWSERYGLNGQVFKMPKFRTMSASSRIISREIAAETDISFTPIGRTLRKLSLDELPQLVSVIKGDMSLVGPRPLILSDYANGLRGKKPIVYTVRPGITGLAQVNGRNFITPINKTRYDAFYARRLCLFLDIKILLRTFSTILNTQNVK